jgi:hypothetical protein
MSRSGSAPEGSSVVASLCSSSGSLRWYQASGSGVPVRSRVLSYVSASCGRGGGHLEASRSKRNRW